MTHLDDLSWLAANQPDAPAPTGRATSTARRSLVAHISSTERPAPMRAPRGAARARAQRRWLRPSRVLAATAVAGIAAAALALPLVNSGGGSLVPSADAAPLVKLSKAVGQTPTPAGDATLVIRHHTFPDDKPFDGADLYADNGAYYYAPTAAGLPADIADPAQPGAGEKSWFGRELAAAIAAPNLPIDEARKGMANAAFEPGFDPTAVNPPAMVVDVPAAAAEELAKMQTERAELAKKHLTEADLSDQTQMDSRIWTNSLDVLTAAASRADVRAGVLGLLATVESATVKESTLDGRTVLEVANVMGRDNYTETLVIDAGTGVPVKFMGGDAGKAPSVVVTYRVSRVTVADIAKG